MAEKRSKSNSESAARRKSTQRSKSGSSSSSSSSSGQSKSDPTRTESKVAARVALDEGSANPRDQLEQQAKDQEKRQAQALRDGVVSGDAKKAHDEREKVGKDNRAALRQPAGTEPQGPVGGFVDQTVARPGDALQGHFVTVDLSNKDVPDRLRENGRDYGVYVEPAEIGPDGYPLTAQIRLRDETNELVTVPYAALSATERRGR